MEHVHGKWKKATNPKTKTINQLMKVLFFTILPISLSLVLLSTPSSISYAVLLATCAKFNLAEPVFILSLTKHRAWMLNCVFIYKAEL